MGLLRSSTACRVRLRRCRRAAPRAARGANGAAAAAARAFHAGRVAAATAADVAAAPPASIRVACTWRASAAAVGAAFGAAAPLPAAAAGPVPWRIRWATVCCAADGLWSRFRRPSDAAARSAAAAAPARPASRAAVASSREIVDVKPCKLRVCVVCYMIQQMMSSEWSLSVARFCQAHVTSEHRCTPPTAPTDPPSSFCDQHTRQLPC